MAKTKIIWSNRARFILFEILEYYNRKNKSKSYSGKLYKKINKSVKLLQKNPEIGINSEIESVSGLIIGDYIVFYEIDSDRIIILTIWDSRQNPDKLQIKKYIP